MENLFFVSSKLGWALIAPGNFFVILAVAAWICLVANWIRLSRLLLSISALLLLLVGTLPVGEWLLAPLEKQFSANAALPRSPAGVIVLGGAVDPALSEAWGQTETGEAAERLIAMVYLANLYPDAQMIFTGGSGSVSETEYKEADYVRFLFEQLAPRDRAILYESQARNTEENVRNSKALINPKPNEDWVLVSSAFHMPRAVGAFCQAGWPVVPYPVDHRTQQGRLLRLSFDFGTNLRILELALHEWVGLLAYRLTGRSDRLLAGDQNQCSAATG